jgi:hypothetical protein
VFWLNLQCVSADVRREADDNCVLQGCYAVSRVVSYRRFGEKYRSYHQESNICLYSWSLRMCTIWWTEAPIRKYHHSLRNNRDVRGSLLTLHYLFHIAHPNYAVQFYLIAIKYLGRNSVIKYFITQFSSVVSYFVSFSSRHFLQHPYLHTLSKLIIPSV